MSKEDDGRKSRRKKTKHKKAALGLIYPTTALICLLTELLRLWEAGHFILS